MAGCLIYTDIESVTKSLKCFLCFDNCGVDGADQNSIKDPTDANGMLTPYSPLSLSVPSHPLFSQPRTTRQFLSPPRTLLLSLYPHLIEGLVYTPFNAAPNHITFEELWKRLKDSLVGLWRFGQSRFWLSSPSDTKSEVSVTTWTPSRFRKVRPSDTPKFSTCSSPLSSGGSSFAGVFLLAIFFPALTLLGFFFVTFAAVSVLASPVL
jgi:hypothetical protein